MAEIPSFDQLADRLRRLSVNESSTPEAINEIMAMSLEELQRLPVDFGKAHLGKTFKDMLKEPRYLTWFAETYRHSKKPSHVKFLRFIQLHVEKSEQQLSHAQPKSVAKSKAASKPMARPQIPEDPWNQTTSEEELEIEGPDGEMWAAVNPPKPDEMQNVQARIGHMENMMTQILSHLNQSQPGLNNVP